MSRKKTNYVLLALLLLATITTFLCNKTQTNHTYKESYFSNFQKIIIEKEKFATDFITDLKSKTSDGTFSSFEQFRNDNKRKIEKQDLLFFAYEGDSCLYWSSNKISPNCGFRESKSKLFFSGNAWYLVFHDDNNTKKSYSVLLLLKNQYSFENQYLTNNFQKDFTIDETLEIYNEPCENSIEIYDRNGDFLLSLSTDSKLSHNKLQSNTATISYILAILLFLILLERIEYPEKLRWLPLIGFILIFIINHWSTTFCEGNPLFDTNNYQSIFANSLGTLLVDSLIILFFTHRICKFPSILKSIDYSIYAIVSIAFCYIFFALTQSLLFDSTFDLRLYNLLYTNTLSFIAYIILGIIAFAYFQLLIHFSPKIAHKSKKGTWLYVVICIIISTIIFYFTTNKWYLCEVFFILTFGTSLFIIPEKKKNVIQLIYIILAVVFTELNLSICLQEKNAQEREELAVALENEHDNVAEAFLSKVYQSTRHDKELQKLIAESHNKNGDVYAYLQKTYFANMLKNYELECTVCGSSNEFNSTNQLSYCDQYFKQIVGASGKAFPTQTIISLTIKMEQSPISIVFNTLPMKMPQNYI